MIRLKKLPTKNKFIGIRLNQFDWEAFYKVANKEGKTVSQVAREVISKYVKEKNE